MIAAMNNKGELPSTIMGVSVVVDIFVLLAELPAFWRTNCRQFEILDKVDTFMNK